MLMAFEIPLLGGERNSLAQGDPGKDGHCAESRLAVAWAGLVTGTSLESWEQLKPSCGDCCTTW